MRANRIVERLERRQTHGVNVLTHPEVVNGNRVAIQKLYNSLTHKNERRASAEHENVDKAMAE